eukprot:scaffold5136_cov229-Pinguiococcus_pyrenoidosus.AAC.4
MDTAANSRRTVEEFECKSSPRDSWRLRGVGFGAKLDAKRSKTGILCVENFNRSSVQRLVSELAVAPEILAIQIEASQPQRRFCALQRRRRVARVITTLQGSEESVTKAEKREKAQVSPTNPSLSRRKLWSSGRMPGKSGAQSASSRYWKICRCFMLS